MVQLKGTLIDSATGVLNEVNDNLSSADRCLGSQATYGMVLVAGGGKNYTGYVSVGVAATPILYAFYYTPGGTTVTTTAGYSVYGQVWWIATTSV